MLKNKIMPTVVLSAICIVTVAILALVNVFTAPAIKSNQEAKANAALLEVMPNGDRFEEIKVNGLPECITKAHKSLNGGYVFQTDVKGYNSGLIIICGVNSNGIITGAKVIESNETMGAENELGDKYVGKDISNYVDVVSGSTAKLTVNAYKEAIKAALDAYEILAGGENNG